MHSTSGSSPARLAASITGSGVLKNLTAPITRTARSAHTARATLTPLAPPGFSSLATAPTPNARAHWQVRLDPLHRMAGHLAGALACLLFIFLATAAPAAGNHGPSGTRAMTAAVATIAAGADHSCAVKTDGRLACWGTNNYGQTNAPTDTFTQLAAGYDHSCGLKTDGTLACWGRNSNGQATAPTGSFTQIAAGVYYSCGIKTDATLTCWGDNFYGQNNAPAGSFIQIVAGAFHTCGLKTGGTLACWGNNDNGRATAPAGTFTQIAAGSHHNCGLKTDGTLACWGLNNAGQATSPAGSFGQRQVAAGEYHNCGIKTDGTLACWGRNNAGQATAPAGTFTQVAPGYTHSCGLKTDGTLACWGNNDEGQASAPAGTFTQVTAGYFHNCGLRTNGTAVCWGRSAQGQATAPAGTFTQVAAGSLHSCGVRTDGTLACWGNNSFGQRTAPTGSFTQIAVGSDHSCGVKTDGTLACWGNNSFGQATAPAGSFTQLAAGDAHSCGLKTDGTLACWGYNGDDQANPPTGTFSQVTAGYLHSCGVKTGGALVCWGNNDANQTNVLASLTATAGTPQTAVVGATFATALNVRAVDQLGSNPSGVSIAFSAPGAGASATLGASPVVTNSAGEASVTATANLIAGSYNVTASTAGATSATFALTNIPLLSQTITGFAPASPVVFGAAAQTLTATPGASTSPLVFSLTSGPCALVGASLSYTGAGNCVVAVNQAADANYTAASPVTATVVVGKANQTITGFVPTTPVVFVAAAQTLTATPGASSSPLIFSLTSGPCALAGASLSYTGAGNCVVAVNQAADANYNAASPVTATVVVGKANQVITGFVPTTPVVFGAVAQTLSATPGASTSALVFSLASGPCALAGASLSYAGAGNCVVAVNQAADANYNAASPVTATVVVGKANQAITAFAPATPVVFGAAAQMLTATPGASASPLVFSLTSGPCALAGASLSYTGAGNCVVAVNQAADANYSAASPVTATVVVGKANQAIVFGTPPSIAVGGTGTVIATGGLSANAVTFSSTTPLVCTINVATATALTAGNCIIAADQLGNSNYNASPQVLQTIGVGKASQTITGFTPVSPVVFGTSSQTLTATPGASTSPLVFSLTSGPCALTGASLSYTGAGNCVVAVNQSADANYNAAGQLSATVVVNKAAQAITFGAAPSIAVGGTASVTATGGASSNVVTFTSTTPTICTISGSVVTAILGGNCIIAANQLGNGNYNAALQVTQTIAIGASSSTMTISSSANPSKAGQPITFNVVVTPAIPSTASTSDLKASTQPSAIPTGSVTFTDNGTIVGTVALNSAGQASFSITLSTPGNHAIKASYAGDASNAAASATVIQAVDALIVPTLSVWMLALLGLMLATFAVRARRNA